MPSVIVITQVPAATGVIVTVFVETDAVATPAFDDVAVHVPTLFERVVVWFVPTTAATTLGVDVRLAGLVVNPST